MSDSMRQSAWSAIAPWVISLAVHGVIAGIFVTITIQGPSDAAAERDPAQAAMEILNDPPLETPVMERLNFSELEPADARQDPTLTPPATAPLETPTVATLTTPAGSSNSGMAFAASAGTGRAGSEFFGVRSGGAGICYVVDRSGSMALGWDYVRNEVKRSVARLNPGQYFQIVLFSSGDPVSMDPVGELHRAHRGPSAKRRGIHGPCDTGLGGDHADGLGRDCQSAAGGL